MKKSNRVPKISQFGFAAAEANKAKNMKNTGKRKHILLHKEAKIKYTVRGVSIVWSIRYKQKQSTKYSTGIKLENGEEWHPKGNMIIKNNRKSQILTLKTLEFQKMFDRFMRDGVEVDAQYLADAFRGIAEERPNTLIDAVTAYIEEIYRPQYEAGNIVFDVWQRKFRFLAQIQRFIRETFDKDDYLLCQINPAFADRFYVQLTSKCNYGLEYARKIMEFMKSSINYAVANGWTEKNPIQYKSWKRAKKAVETLTETELQKLEEIPIINDSLDAARDIFLFCSYTGLAFCDVKELTPSHLFQSAENQWFIRKNRGKNNEMSIVPLLPRCEEIIRKYDRHQQQNGTLLPVISNAKYNDKLKVLAELIGFQRFPLSSHIARKTCATMFLNRGLPMATVAGVLGHSSTKTTEKFYAVMREETILKQVFEAFQSRQAQ